MGLSLGDEIPEKSHHIFNQILVSVYAQNGEYLFVLVG